MDIFKEQDLLECSSSCTSTRVIIKSVLGDLLWVYGLNTAPVIKSVLFRHAQLCCCLCLLFSSLTVYGQQGSFVGEVRDSSANIALVEATAILLNATDSILVGYTYTDAEGRFGFDAGEGDYLVMVSYPDYADHVFPLSIRDQKAYDEPIMIYLSSRSMLLEEVIVHARPMDFVVKGDTIEFDAAAYQIRPNANVEELLKQLPGIVVDYNGRIKAFGQDVARVYVDGEEFFGDDPTLVTRNLRGDMVDKVQLYDKKSDLAELTGVDIGEKEKTINIKLKEDKKKGHFGKLDAGAGTEGYYRGQGMFNRFSAKTKFAMYGNAATTGMVDLNSSDRGKYGVKGGTISFIGGDILRSGVKYDELSTSSGRYEGMGRPEALSGGVHYNGKWDSDRQRINATFKTGHLTADGEQLTLAENTLPEDVLISNSGQQFRNALFRNRIDAVYEYELDTTSKIKFSVEGLKRETQRNNEYQVTTRNGSGNLVNESNRALDEQGDENMFDIGGMYSKKFKKDGRSLTVDVSSAYGNVQSDGFLNADNTFLGESGVQYQEFINQYRKNSLRQSIITGAATYSERLAKGLTGILSYGIGSSREKTERQTFDNGVSTDQESPIPEFSVDFLLNQLSNYAGLSLYYQINKHTFEAGNKVALVNFKQYDRSGQESLIRDFVTWNPRVSYQFKPRQEDLLTVRYTGNNVLPTSMQLQPTQINDDPLNIVAGNPLLTSSYRNDFTLSYRFYRPSSGFNFNLNSGFQWIANPVVNSMQTDGFGKTVYTPVNLSDMANTNLHAKLNLGKKIEKPDLFTGLALSISSGNTYGLSNGIVQKRAIHRYSADLQLSRNRPKYFITVIGMPFYSRNYSNLNNLLDNSGGGVEGNLYFGVTLPADFSISGTGQYDYQEKTDAFPQGIDLFTFNAALEKKFLKTKALSLKLSVNDLLNQNQGFNRSSVGTTVTQHTYTTIQRYYMVSLAWDFSKFGSLSQ